MLQTKTTESINKSVLFGVGLISFAVILYEICLTRIFAVTLWYYFGVLAISLAMLGMTIAAIFCYLNADWISNHSRHRDHMAFFALIFSLFAPLAIFVHIATDFTVYHLGSFGFYAELTIQIVLLAFVFFNAGLCISIALFHYARDINCVYAYDLIGAGLGSALIIPLLYIVNPVTMTFLIAAIGVLAALTFAWHKHTYFSRYVLIILALFATSLFFMNQHWNFFHIQRIKSYHAGELQRNETQMVYEKWSPLSRVTVYQPYQTAHFEGMRINNDGGAPTVLYHFNGDLTTIPWIKQDSREVVYLLKNNADTLVIGSGGGGDVLAALAYNESNITAVEINPVIADIANSIYANYIGHIFQAAEVKLIVQEGRNFVASTDNHYDIILVAMIDSWEGAAAGAYLFNENALYTLQAIHDYMSHLNPDGILSISRYYPWDEMLRLTNLTATYLHNAGIQDVSKRFIIVVEPPTEYRRATLLLKNGEFTPLEVNKLMQHASKNHYLVIYAPGVDDSQLMQDPSARVIRELINPQAYGIKNTADIIKNYPLNISPSTDNKPFFFFMQRPQDVFKINPNDHAARRLAMPILYGMFIIFALLAILTIFLPLMIGQKKNSKADPLTHHNDIDTAINCLSLTKNKVVYQESSSIDLPSHERLLLYFACLGIGYMLIEISLMQRLTVFLGHPSYSFVVVLASLLLFSGVGSWSVGNAQKLHYVQLLIVLLLIVVTVTFYAFILYDKFIAWMWMDRLSRIMVSIITMVPLGILMGMCFPLGMNIAQRLDKKLIPWAWGVNGAFSVFASIFALIIALSVGLKVTLVVGAGGYLLAMISICKWNLFNRS